MNKLMVAVFDDEKAADAGLKALRALHTAGDITLYATGVLAMDGQGTLSVKEPMDAGPVGAVTGLAVGSLIGLFGGPAGMAIGAVTGSLFGALRDFWTAGVGLDFVEEVARQLQPGKVALVAELEEEWVFPADSVLEAAGGKVMRRTRTEIAELQFDQDITAFKAEIKALESEASHAGGTAKEKLQTKLAAAKDSLEGAVLGAQRRVDMLKQEADAKAESLKLQLGQVKGDVKAKIEERVKRVRSAYHARGAKLSRAWSLAKEAVVA
jgi:uncharacterized membrane protein